ncbi:MAG: nitroreductase family protein [Candidatus Dormibacteraceae bacterium]
MSGPVSATDLLDLLATRRVCRDFLADPVAEEDLVALLEAARWATSAGNLRVHRFLVIQDPDRIRLTRALAPGVLGVPPAIVAICVDLDVAERAGVRPDRDTSVIIDVGTAAMAMMAEAHALGLGTCPATSFSQAGVQTVLGLPAPARPEMLLLVGHPAQVAARPRRRPPRHPSPKLLEIAYWERYGEPLPRPSVYGSTSSGGVWGPRL